MRSVQFKILSYYCYYSSEISKMQRRKFEVKDVFLSEAIALKFGSTVYLFNIEWSNTI